MSAFIKHSTFNETLIEKIGKLSPPDDMDSEVVKIKNKTHSAQNNKTATKPKNVNKD